MKSTLTPILLASFLAAASACTVGGRPAFAEGKSAAASPLAPGAVYHYAGHLGIDPKTTALSAAWSITVSAHAPRQLGFLLSGSFEDVTVEGATFSVSPAAGPFAELALFRVAVALPPGEVTLAVTYAGILFDDALPGQINSISPDKIELTVDSFWMPFDERFSSRLTADVVIDVPGEWTVLSTGRVDGKRVTIDSPALDIPLTLLANARRVADARYQVFDTREGEHSLSALTQMTAFCTEFLDGRFGEREPLPVATIVIHDRPDSGYSRGTLIALTNSIGESVDDRQLQFVCHEFAHFWSSNGNPATVENWLNESFAEYIGIMAVREFSGESAYEKRLAAYRRQLDGEELPPIWTPSITTRRPYLVNYRKGPLALAALEARIGRDSFADVVRRMMVERVATTPGLLAVVAEEAGDEARAWFEEMLAR